MQLFKTIQILFVGNSLTTRNNLPNMLQMMILRRGLGEGETVYTASIARPSVSLNSFTNDFYTDIFRQQRWTHVILQEQSDKLSLGTMFERKYTWPSATKIVSNLQEGVELVLYETMAHKGGNRVDDTYNLMQTRVTEGYENLAIELERVFPYLSINVCPVGRVWSKMIEDLVKLKKKPLVLLYTDSVHPSVSGTYLTSLVFFRLITGRQAKSIKLSYRPKGVSKWFAIRAQLITDRTMNDLEKEL
jgi:hypothetical protein